MNLLGPARQHAFHSPSVATVMLVVNFMSVKEPIFHRMELIHLRNIRCLVYGLFPRIGGQYGWLCFGQKDGWLSEG